MIARVVIPRIVKGAAIDRQSKLRASGASHDLQMIMGLNSESSKYHSPLQNYIKTPHPSWEELIYSFRKTTRQLQSNGGWTKVNFKSIFISIRLGYKDLLWRRLSIDLVAACLRQREFATKITGEPCKYLDSSGPLSRSAIRYGKFLALMKPQGSFKRKYSLVPTLDIDLWWHTHQLHPCLYREWCITHLSRPINHDDTIRTVDLKKSFRKTSLRWYEVYSEQYTTDDSKGRHISFWRAVVGFLSPPLSLIHGRRQPFQM